MGKSSSRKKLLKNIIRKAEGEPVVTDVSGRIQILRVMEYLKVHFILRLVDGTMFEYIIFHNGQFFNNYMQFDPAETKKGLTKEQIHNGEQMILAGCMTTIESLTGKKPIVDERSEAIAGELIKATESLDRNMAHQS